jgi:hypothetical protein
MARMLLPGEWACALHGTCGSVEGGTGCVECALGDAPRLAFRIETEHDRERSREWRRRRFQR